MADTPILPHKTCTKCAQTKPVDAFSIARKTKDGRKHQCKQCDANYRLANREAANARDAAYYAANRDERLAKNKAWADANQDKIKAAGVEYRAANKEAIAANKAAYYQENKQARTDYYNAWAQTPEGIAARRAAKVRRRAREQDLECGCVSASALLLITELDNNLCVYCGDEATSYDHVEPLASGGSHCVANLRRACTTCNIRKKDADFETFVARSLRANVTLLLTEIPTALMECPQA